MLALSPNSKNPLVYSETIFVHNNSKHGRKSALPSSTKCKPLQPKEKAPVIQRIIPSEGLPTGGTQVVIIGENFFEGLQVVFGSLLVWSVEIVTSSVLRVTSPPYPVPGAVDVILACNSKPLLNGTPGVFVYTSKLFLTQ